jgi:hypothetical protein
MACRARHPGSYVSPLMGRIRRSDESAFCVPTAVRSNGALRSRSGCRGRVIRQFGRLNQRVAWASLGSRS